MSYHVHSRSALRADPELLIRAQAYAAKAGVELVDLILFSVDMALCSCSHDVELEGELIHKSMLRRGYFEEDHDGVAAKRPA